LDVAKIEIDDIMNIYSLIARIEVQKAHFESEIRFTESIRDRIPDSETKTNFGIRAPESRIFRSNRRNRFVHRDGGPLFSVWYTNTQNPAV
jgi:hypothetical protein